MDKINDFRKYINILNESQAKVSVVPEFDLRRFIRDSRNVGLPPLKIEDNKDGLVRLFFNTQAFAKFAPKLINEPEGADIGIKYIIKTLNKKYPQLYITNELDFQKFHTGKDSQYVILDVIAKDGATEHDDFDRAEKIANGTVNHIPVDIYERSDGDGELIAIKGDKNHYINFFRGYGDQEPYFDYKGKMFYPYDDLNINEGIELVKKYDNADREPLLKIVFEFFKIH